MKAREKILIGSASCAAFLATASAAGAQDHAFHPNFNSWLAFSLLEIPFLLLAIAYAVRTARALQGGVFGRGMALMAGGMLVMAVGHLLMMADMVFGTNILAMIFGFTVGGILWVAALLSSWALVGTGFHSIYRASKA